MSLFGSLRWAVVDVETTGLSPGIDRVLSVAVVHVDETGETERVWSTLLDPGCDPGPVDVHGLTREMVRGAPTFEQIVGLLRRRLEGRVFVAHNAAFDWQFLVAEAALVGATLPNTHRLCTLALARRLELDLPDHRLGTLAAHWGITQKHAHDALDDARVAATVLKLAASHAREAAIPLPLLAVTDRSFTNPPVPMYDRRWRNPGVFTDGGPLVQGMRIVITGPTAASRASLYARCHAAGLDLKNVVNRKASLLVCNDPASATVKSRNARAHGIPVVEEAALVRLLEDVQPGKPAEEELLPVPRRRPSRVVQPRREPVGPLAMKRILVLGGPHHVAAGFRERIAAAGGMPAINVTSRITHAVVLDGGRDDPRFGRLLDLGVRLVDPADFDSLLAGPVGDSRQADSRVLSRGEVTDLPVDGQGPVWTVTASWSWEGDEVHEVDVVAFVLDEVERVRDDEDFIFYNYTGSAETGVELVVDGPNEQSIRLDVDALPTWCQRVRIAAALVTPLDFGALGPVQIHLRNGRDTLWLSSTLDAATSECSLILADVYRRGDQWRFRAIGQGYEYGLDRFATELGVEIE